MHIRFGIPHGYGYITDPNRSYLLSGLDNCYTVFIITMADRGQTWRTTCINCAGSNRRYGYIRTSTPWFQCVLGQGYIFRICYGNRTVCNLCELRLWGFSNIFSRRITSLLFYSPAVTLSWYSACLSVSVPAWWLISNCLFSIPKALIQTAHWQCSYWISSEAAWRRWDNF